MNEVYTVYLNAADPRGLRKEQFKQASGWQMDRLDNGVLMLFNDSTKTMIEYSPYAWQSISTANVNTQEDTSG